jgi:spore coat polysaccharide biosynthesis protein SpsF
MSSRRLPGKVMMRVHGTPLLGHLLDRLERAKGVDGVVIATSVDALDDAVAAYAVERRVACHRGSLDDVAGRVLGAAAQVGAEHILRVSGDSPMLDPAIATRAIELYRKRRADLVTNVQTRTFPKGQSVEVLSARMLESVHADMDDGDREHVTPYFYRHPERFSIVNFEYSGARGDVQLSVDTLEDLRLFERITSMLGAPFWRHGLERLLDIRDEFVKCSDAAA